ncbi:MAG: ATP-binding protein, partial [Planctomycetota bacterium]
HKPGQLLQGKDTDREIVDRIRDAIRQRQPCNEVLLNYRKNGQPYWNQVNIQPLYDDKGALTHFMGMQSDITEQRNYQHSLTEAKEEAEQSAQAKARFLATMSHEIRTPLNGTIGALDLLLASNLDADQALLGNTAQTCAHNLLHLINDILDFSKMEDGSLTLEQMPISLTSLISEIFTITQELAADKGIEQITDIAASVPHCLLADPTRIKQILLNLISNAIKFSPAGSITVQAGGSTTDGKYFNLELAVIDHGIGITPEAVPLLFSPFTQAETSTTRRFGGTGLGLAICHHIVTAYNGTVTVDSTPNVGTTITVHLPLAIAADNTSTRMTASGPAAIRFDGYHVLVAEDNPVNQMVVRRQLENLGCQVFIANNGAEAVAAHHEHDFDLILMDCHMPVVDGFDATRQIRATNPGSHQIPPIIAVTANALDGDRELCLNAGMNDYLSKPVKAEDLARCCAKWIA